MHPVQRMCSTVLDISLKTNLPHSVLNKVVILWALLILLASRSLSFLVHAVFDTYIDYFFVCSENFFISSTGLITFDCTHSGLNYCLNRGMLVRKFTFYHYCMIPNFCLNSFS